MDQLRALRTFVRVIDEGSFAAAARSLDAAPAVVTRLVADLEQSLGARLLHRTTRRLTLTAVGAEYAERARQILADLDEADALAASTTATLSGMLRVTGPLPFLQLQVAPLLPEFLARHPGVQFHFSTLAEPLAGAPDEHADVSLLLVGQRPLDGDFIARQVATAEILMCAAPSYLERHGRPTQPEDLLQHELLIPTLAAAPREWRLRRSGEGGAAVTRHVMPSPKPASVNASNSALLLGAALAGMGVAGTLSFLVVDALRSGRLERVLPEWVIGSYGIYATLPSRKYMPQRARVFTDFLVEKFGVGERDPWLDALAGTRAVSAT